VFFRNTRVGAASMEITEYWYIEAGKQSSHIRNIRVGDGEAGGHVPPNP